MFSMEPSESRSSSARNEETESYLRLLGDFLRPFFFGLTYLTVSDDVILICLITADTWVSVSTSLTSSLSRYFVKLLKML